MTNKILVINANNIHLKSLAEELSQFFIITEVDSYPHAIEYLKKEYNSTQLILVSNDIFSQKDYSMIDEMNRNMMLKAIPVICIGDTPLDVSTLNCAEIKVLEHGAIDFFVPPFNVTIIRYHMNQLIQYRNSLACAHTISSETLTPDGPMNLNNHSESSSDPHHFSAKHRVAMMEQLKIIMRHFSEGITAAHVISNKFNYIYANSNFYSLIGYTESEFESELCGDLSKLILPEYLPTVMASLQLGAKEIDSKPLEFQIRRKDGSLIWLRVRNSACYLYSADIPVYICIYEDITLAKKTELRISSINEKLGNSEVFVQFEITGRVLENYYSKYEPQKTMNGLSKQENIIEEFLLAPVYEDDKEDLTKALAIPTLISYYQNGEPKFSVEYRRHMPTGEIRWFCATCILLEGITSGTINALIYCHNIHDKVQKRLAIRKVVDTDIDDITIINISTCSTQVIQIHDGSIVDLGESEYEVSIQNYIDTQVAEEDKIRCTDLYSFQNVMKNVEKDNAYDFSYWTVLADGSNRRKNVSFIYLDSTHDDLLMVGKDITELFEREQMQQLALRHSAALANAANLAKSNFLSNMSHDMRTPLNAILGLTALAKSKSNSPDMAEFLRNIEVSSQYLLNLINDTLDLSKIESGKLELHEEPYQLEEFILGINTVIKPLMDAKHIDFVVSLKHDVECIVVDKLRFTQVIFNLLSNAAKYTPEGGRVEISSEEIPEKDGKFGMRFYICDNGIGMSRDYQKVLFDRYTQESRPSHSEQKGTGLGMAIVKQIVDLSGGHIEVESELNKGTTFVLDLYAYSISHPKPEAKPKQNYDKLSGTHVLLADDMKINSMITQKILETKGCIVDAAANGSEALNMFMSTAPGYYSIIFTDVRMPVMDGLELTRRIRGLNRPDAQSIPIIGATADAYTENQDLTLLSGMNARLIKPIMPEKLYETILELIEKNVPFKSILD